MARNKGFKVPATVVTLDSKDKYPVVDSNDIAGGYHSIPKELDRFTIPFLRRKVGMLVYSIDTKKCYRLINNPTFIDTTTAKDWEEVSVPNATAFSTLVDQTSLTNTLANYAQTKDLPDMTKYTTTADLQKDYATKDDIKDFQTTTQLDQNYASKEEFDKVKDDLGKTVVAVKRLDIIEVNYNTPIKQISLPTEVLITLANGTSGNYPVTWNTSSYRPLLSGMQILNGTVTLPTGALNSVVNVTQHILVGDETHTIFSFTNQNPIPLTADYNEPWDDINIPEKVSVTYTDGTTGMIDVDWSSAKKQYNPTTLTDQVLSGTLVLPVGVTQGSTPVVPQVKILARTKPQNIKSQTPLSDLGIVVLGTSINSLKLPASNTVKLEDGTTRTLKIKWNAASYNPNETGKKTITGEYILDKDILNENNVFPEETVTVGSEPDLVSVTTPNTVNVSLNTPIDSITLPSKLDGTFLTYDDKTITAPVDITWDRAGANYDPTKPGSYFIDGAITVPSGYTNLTDTFVTAQVDVVAATVTNVKSVSHVSMTVDNGTLESALTKPSKVDIVITSSDPNVADTNGKADVVWDATSTPAYDGLTAGTYVYKGTITPEDTSVQNTAGLKAQLIVTVKAAPIATSYVIKSVADAGVQNNLTEGDPLTNIVPPATLDVVYSEIGETVADHTVTGVNITWNTNAVSTDGTTIAVVGSDKQYTITGTIDMLNSGFPNGITNPNNVVAKYTINVAAKAPAPVVNDTIKSVDNVPNITLNYGSSLADLQSALNQYQTLNIVVQRPDLTTYAKSGVAITWDTTGFDGTRENTTNTYFGTIADLSSENISNENGVKATVTVTIGAKPKVKTIDSWAAPTAVTVDYGTNVSDLKSKLDTTISANITDGGVPSVVTFPVTWDTSKYNGDTSGTYTLAGSVSANDIDGYVNNAGTVPSYTVIVKAKPATALTYKWSTKYTMPVGDSSIFATQVTGLSDVVALGADKSEEALKGTYDESSDTFNPSTRKLEVRFLGTATNPIASPGIRVPVANSTEDECSAFQAKISSLGLDGVCGSINAPVTVTWAFGSSDSDSGLQFSNAMMNSPIFLIREAENGYIPYPDTENPVK